MSDQLIRVAALGAAAFAVTFALVPPSRSFALRRGIVKGPGPGHSHRKSTPEFGGPAIVAGCFIPLLWSGAPPKLAAATIAMLALGVLDDLANLGARGKFVVQTIIAAAYVLAVDEIGPAPCTWAAAAATIFWLLAATNAINLIDGLDGLASGLGAIACAGLVAASFLHHRVQDAYVAVTLGAALLGFLVYNRNPASIFMGDGGALATGFLLGVLSIQAARAGGNSPVAAYVFPVFLLIVPLLDIALVTLSRLATGRSIWSRGLDHSHHRLLSLGMPNRTAVIFCWGVATIGGAYAVAATVMPYPYVITTVPIFSALFVPYALFLLDLSFEKQSPATIYRSANRLARTLLALAYRMRVVDVAVDSLMVVASYFAVSILLLNFRVTNDSVAGLLAGLPLVLAASCGAFILARVYRGIWRYVGSADLIRFGKGAALAGAILFAAACTRRVPLSPAGAVLFSILLLDLLIASRVCFRTMRKVLTSMAVPANLTLIIGAGRRGDAAARDLAARTERRTHVVGFVDEDAFTHGKTIDGIPVLGGIDQLASIYADSTFDEIVIADVLDETNIERLRRFASERGLRLCAYSVEFSELDCRETISNTMLRKAELEM